MTQSSIRHDDMRRTPIASCRWITGREDDTVKGPWAQASATRTFPKSWVCSTGAISETGAERLIRLVTMLKESRSKKISTDDRFWKKDAARQEWCPCDGLADALHIRYLPYAERKQEEACTTFRTCSQMKKLQR